MLKIRKADDRGRFDFGWLDTRHTFSFGEYHDPAHMGFRSLRVLNEDKVEPGQGFGTHGHRDMEIVTYVLSGALEHKDSTGTHGVIRPGDAQRMSAGSGIRHSEFNASDKDPVHFLQIWIIPSERGITPGYEQKSFSAGAGKNALRAIASPDGREGSVKVKQDAIILAADLEAGKEVTHAMAPGRGAWIQVARGSVELTAGKSLTLSAGDGAAVEGEAGLTLHAVAASEVLVFDLA